MKTIGIAVALIALIASPALAQSKRKAPRAPQATYPGAYPGSGRVNTDPDPNVQFEILRQQNWRKGG